MDPDLFLADLEAKPAALDTLARELSAQDAWAALPTSVSRVLLLGMGSSRYAALTAARRLRAAGIDATAEYASVERTYPAHPDTLVVAVSANGKSRETLEAAARYPGYVALTNAPAAPLADSAGLVVPMHAGTEEGGLASRSFLHSLVLLLALEQHLTGRPLDLPGLCSRTAEAITDLLDRRTAWLESTVELLDSTDGVFTIAPAERISSAEQSAVIFREGPRRRADAGETGDWSHVDVYLTQTLDYRALFFPGSRYDAAALEWLHQRSATVIAVGADVPDAKLVVRFRHDDDLDVRLLTEVLVAELVATTWWAGVW
ncbi:MAG TPA: iron dicitrate transport regulator FecR [Rugosimonospora sp.]|nr:iron dicitrate transport regulator FecR [Rugosimonospora sp.]